jgi:hypothetical protein
MAANTQIATQVILSAQDRGMTTLLKKVAGEADASIDAFSKLGMAITGALGGLTNGYLLKKAMDSIDDFRMSVMSVAVTLTDTLRGTGADMQKAFDQNKKHAESFFYLLQKQSTRSLATFEQLQNAYTMFANKGLSLSPTQASVTSLASLVDRIVLATKGQNQNIQIIQELRSILNGQARPTDALATLFKGRDADFQKRVKELVGRGDGSAVVEYLNSLIADVDISGELAKNLSKSLTRTQMSVKLWAIQAFSPLHDELAGAFNSLADGLDGQGGRGANALLQGMNDMAKGVTEAFRALRSALTSFANSKAFEVFASIAPTFLAVASATTSATMAFGLFKAAAMSGLMAMKTVPGMVGAVTAGGFAASQWAGRQVSSQEAQRQYEEDNSSENNTQVIKSAVADLIDSAMSILSGIGTGLASVFMDLMEYIRGLWNTIASKAMEMIAEIIQAAQTAFMRFQTFVDILKNMWENAISWLKTQVTNGIVNPIMSMYHATMSKVTFGSKATEHRRLAEAYLGDEKRAVFTATPLATKYSNADMTTASPLVESIRNLAAEMREQNSRMPRGMYSILPTSEKVGWFVDSVKKAFNSSVDVAVQTFDKRQTARERQEQAQQQQATSAWTLPKEAPAEADTKAAKLISAISMANTAQHRLNEMYRLIGGRSASGDAFQSLGQSNMLLQKIVELERTADGRMETQEEATARMAQIQEQIKANMGSVVDSLREEAEYFRTLASLKGADTVGAGLLGGVMEYAHDNDQTTYQIWSQFAKDAMTSIKDTFSDGLYQMFMEGKVELRSLMANFGQALVRSLTDMMAQSLVEAGAKGISSGIGGFVASMFGGGAAAANGAVWHGGFTPFHAFASGGIVRRPTLGLIGEAGMNEAVVPLPDGKSIPVVMRGGGSPQVVVNINDRSGAGTRKSVNQSTDGEGNLVIDVVIDAVMRNVNGSRNALRSALGVEG